MVKEVLGGQLREDVERLAKGLGIVLLLHLIEYWVYLVLV